MSIRHQDAVRPSDQAAKAGCYLCLRNTGGMLDLDIVIEGEGRLFLCDQHGFEIAQTLGCLSPQKSQALERRIKDDELVLKGLREALRDKEALIAEQSSFISKQLHKKPAPKASPSSPSSPKKPSE